MRVDDALITASERGHDRLPALAHRISSGRRSAILRRSSVCSISQRSAEANRSARFSASHENSGRTRSTVSPTPPARERHDRQSRCHRLEDDVAEGLGQAREGEDVGRGVVIGQICSPGDSPRNERSSRSAARALRDGPSPTSRMRTSGRRDATIAKASAR